MIVKATTEFIGTFIFLTVILVVVYTGDKENSPALAIGVALAAVIFFGGAISGGHFNPAISSMFYMKGDMNEKELGSYVVAQLLGGAAALAFFNYSKDLIKKK